MNKKSYFLCLFICAGLLNANMSAQQPTGRRIGLPAPAPTPQQPVSTAPALERIARERAQRALDESNAGNILAAKDLVDSALELKPDLALALALRGRIASRLFLVSPQAIADSEKSVALEPHNGLFWAFLANNYYSFNKDAAARQAADKALEILATPTNALDHYARGLAFISKDDNDNAILELSRATALQPNFPEAYRLLGQTRGLKGDFSKAFQEFDTALKQNPNFFEVLNSQANIYRLDGLNQIGQNGYDQAITLTNQAITAYPAFARAYFNLASAKSFKKDYTSALVACTTALNINPDSAPTYGLRAAIYGVLSEQNPNNLEKSIRDYSVAITLVPEHLDFYRYRALAYLVKEPEKALKDYSKVIELNPNSLDAYLERGNLYIILKRISEAFADYAKALKLDETYAPTYKRRGLAYYNLGKYQEALVDMQTYIEATNKDPEAYWLRGLLYSLNPGNTLEKKAAYAKALADFDAAIKLNPAEGKYQNAKGNALNDLGRQEEAFASYQEAIKLLGDNSESYQNICNFYLFKSEFDQAIANCTKALAFSPPENQINNIYNLRGLAFTEKNDYEAALTDYSRALTNDPKDFLAMSGRARVYDRQKKYDLVLSEYDKLVGQHPQNELSYSYRGDFHLNRKNYRLALADYDEYIKLKPNLASGYRGRASVFLNQYDFEPASIELAKALEKDSQDVAAIGLQAYTVYGRQRKFDLALSGLDKYVQQNPQNPLGYIYRGNVYLQKQDYAKARADYEMVVKLRPNSLDGYNGRAAVALDQYDDETALIEYGRALEKEPQSTFTLSQRAIVYGRQKKYDLAVREFNQLMSDNPNDKELIKKRGLIYLDWGKYDLAIADFSRVIELTPKYANAYQDRGAAYLRQGKFDLAMADLNRAAELDAFTEYPYATRAEYYLKTGNDALAITEADKALALNPRLPEALWVRGAARLNQGQRNAALADFAQAVAINPQFDEARRDQQLTLNTKGRLSRLTAVRITGQEQEQAQGQGQKQIQARAILPPTVATPTPQATLATNDRAMPTMPAAPGSTPQPAPSPTPKVKEVAAQEMSEMGVINARALDLAKPLYPSDAKARNIGGQVQVRVTVDENGKVIEAIVVSGNPMFARECERAARRSKFQPLIIDRGPAQKFSGLIIYNFKL